MPNPLLSDRDVDFLLYEVHGAERLAQLPAFAEHSRESFDMFLAASRKLAREVLWPAYKPMDADPPVLTKRGVIVHQRMHELYAKMTEFGLGAAARPESVGGQGLPSTVFSLGTGYLMAANGAAYCYVGLTTGAARLIETFGSDELRETYMRPMLAGTWTGTMALTEPHAGSSLADVTTRAMPTGRGDYSIVGTKIFISGGDHDLTENIVHLTLARIEGAPAGIKGVSLFAVPKRRVEADGNLVDNDCHATQVLHKIGWRGLPSIALTFGDAGDCRGWLVGEPNRGIHAMFQMMNEARLMVGMNGAATAAVAYHEALEYARTRPQGRPVAAKDPEQPQVPIIEHADVRRMLLRQKAIVEGALSLLTAASMQADLAEHAESPEARERAKALLDLLTPIAKSFPAERGFEANALAVQVHGGYGYTSEYLPEAWLRDQKLNSIHEGTTGIQGLDLLGRKVVAGGGRAFGIFAREVADTARRARAAGVAEGECAAVERALTAVAATTAELGGRGASGDVEGMLLHSADYLEAFSTLAIAWQWLAQAAAAREGLASGKCNSRDMAFYLGKQSAATYWLATELPRVHQLLALCDAAEPSYGRMQPEWF